MSLFRRELESKQVDTGDESINIPLLPDIEIKCAGIFLSVNKSVPPHYRCGINSTDFFRLTTYCVHPFGICPESNMRNNR